MRSTAPTADNWPSSRYTVVRGNPDSSVRSVSRARPSARRISSSPNGDSITHWPASPRQFSAIRTPPSRDPHWHAAHQFNTSTHPRCAAIPSSTAEIVSWPPRNVRSADQGWLVGTCVLSVANMTDILAEARHLRRSVGQFVTGVAVVTYESDGRPRGVTVNSFTSVSIDPPLILVSISREARAASGLHGSPSVVNVLAADQLDLARHFAGRDPRGGGRDGARSHRLTPATASIERTSNEVHLLAAHSLPASPGRFRGPVPRVGHHPSLFRHRRATARTCRHSRRTR